MDRFQKKCVITSAVVHGTLVLVLLIGPAFFVSSEKLDTKDIIDFIPFKTIEQNMSGGGNPNVPQVIPQPQPTPQPQPQPQPQPAPPPPAPERRAEPEPEKTKLPDKALTPVERNTAKPDPDSLEPNKSSKPKINLIPTVRNTTTQQAQDTAAEKRARDKAAAAAARERTEKFSAALNTIRTGASGSVKIDELRGPGGGGVPYAGFNQALISAYMRAWLIPSEAADENAKVVATITLSRDGTVISARVSKSSGNAELDKSVQRALDKVSFVAPFPEGTKEAQKTFWLEFDPKAKRMMG